MDLQVKREQRKWLLASVVFFTCVVYYMLTPLFKDPGHILLEPTGDGGKNYFTYLYHILYDKGIWFSGMNYPYGEHVIYTDAQPILSVPLSYLKTIIPIDITTALIIMHVSIIISYVLAMVFVYKILIACSVKPLPAMLFSPLVIIMSPQVFRIAGHFALCHTFYIPALLYFLLQAHLTGRRKYVIYLYLVCTFMAFMHPYYAGLSLVLVGLYVLGYCIFQRGKLVPKVKEILPVFGAIVVSIITFQCFMLLTDPAKDRPTMPYGILEYLTAFPDVLTSSYSPLWQLAKDRGWYEDIRSRSEGFAYVGIVPIIALISALLAGLVILVKHFARRGKESKSMPIALSKVWLFTAFAALALAKGIPFVWHMEWLIDDISLFRQFRTLGRFSWIFYYIIAIYGIVVLCRYYNKLLIERKWAAYVVILMPLMIWMYEANGYLHVIREKNNDYASQYDWFFFKKGETWKDFIKAHNYKASDFQAFLILPYTHIGTEKVWVNPFHNWNIVTGYRAMMQLEMPMVDVNMSRSSWSQAEKQVRISGGPWTDKTMLRELKDKRPFLLLEYDENPLSPDEQYLVSVSHSLGKFDQFYVYVCYPENILKGDSLHHSSVKPVIDQMAYRDTCLSCTGTWFVDHFDNYPGTDNVYGKGSMPETMETQKTLAEIAMTSSDSGKQYEASCWALLAKENYKSPVIFYEAVNGSDSVLLRGDVLFKESTDNDGGLWFRASEVFVIPGKCTKVRLILDNTNPPSFRRLDELMLRPWDGTIISKNMDNQVMVNNHISKTKRDQ